MVVDQFGSTSEVPSSHRTCEFGPATELGQHIRPGQPRRVERRRAPITHPPSSGRSASSVLNESGAIRLRRSCPSSCPTPRSRRSGPASLFIDAGPDKQRKSLLDLREDQSQPLRELLKFREESVEDQGHGWLDRHDLHSSAGPLVPNLGRGCCRRRWTWATDKLRTAAGCRNSF